MSPMQSDIHAMLSKGWTSPAEAFHRVNCMSLSQRVGELIEMGHEVQKEWLDLPSGKRVRIYRIQEAQTA